MRFKSVVLTMIGLAAASGFGANAEDEPVSPAITGTATLPADDSNLVIYRSHIAPLLFKATIIIDGRKIASLANGNYVAVRIDAGPHRLSLGWPALSGESGGRVDIDLKQGQRIYLSIVATGRGSLISNPVTGLEPTDPDLALAAIAKCCRYRVPDPP